MERWTVYGSWGAHRTSDEVVVQRLRHRQEEHPEEMIWIHEYIPAKEPPCTPPPPTP